MATTTVRFTPTVEVEVDSEIGSVMRVNLIDYGTPRCSGDPDNYEEAKDLAEDILGDIPRLVEEVE